MPGPGRLDRAGTRSRDHGRRSRCLPAPAPEGGGAAHQLEEEQHEQRVGGELLHTAAGPDHEAGQEWSALQVQPRTGEHERHRVDVEHGNPRVDDPQVVEGPQGCSAQGQPRASAGAEDEPVEQQDRRHPEHHGGDPPANRVVAEDANAGGDDQLAELGVLAVWIGARRRSPVVDVAMLDRLTGDHAGGRCVVALVENVALGRRLGHGRAQVVGAHPGGQHAEQAQQDQRCAGMREPGPRRES